MKKVILLGFLILASCSKNNTKTINGAGATFPYPIYSTWAFDYHKTTKIRLNYQSIGSGGGVKQITNRTVDFGASDAPVSPEKLEKEKLLQFPAIIGGVVPIVNLKGIKTGELKLSGLILSKIYAGEITKWNDPEIVTINKGLALPDNEITTVQRSDGSGTTAIFTTFLSEVDPSFKDKVGVGKSVKWPTGVAAKGNEGVSNYVKRLENTIGYVEYAYAKENNLNHTQLLNKEGNYVSPNVDSFKSAAQYAKWDAAQHFYLWLVNAPGESSWPITGASFILLAKEKPESNKKVIAFYDWAFKNGDKTAIDKTYIPLPETLKNTIRDYWKKNIN